MTLTLPDHIAAMRAMSERELKAELAVSLFAGRRLTLVQAADLAEMSLFEFQHLLRNHGVPQHYDETSLAQDLTNLDALRRV
ncbi:MAG: hypothetical protein QOE70_1117 [Chthoniobacter sp.]|jgi:predicted HTH domain antitoxin|nr:hypothetical protein [Chthoniobacter sp.]